MIWSWLLKMVSLHHLGLQLTGNPFDSAMGFNVRKREEYLSRRGAFKLGSKSQDRTNEGSARRRKGPGSGQGMKQFFK